MNRGILLSENVGEVAKAVKKYDNECRIGVGKAPRHKCFTPD